MELRYTEAELENILKEADAKNSRTGSYELSLDELEGVSGGWSYTENADSITLHFSQKEYDELSPLLNLPIAEQYMKKYGVTKESFKLDTTVSTDAGKFVIDMLNKLYH